MHIWRKPFFPINWKFLSLDVVSSLKSTLEGYYCTLKVGKIFCGRHQSYLVEIMIQNTLSLSQGPMAIRAGFTLLFIYKFLILLLILSFETSCQAHIICGIVKNFCVDFFSIKSLVLFPTTQKSHQHKEIASCGLILFY